MYPKTPRGCTLTLVNGMVRVANGQLIGVDMPALIAQANRHAAELVRRAEQRYHVSLTAPVWRRAYPYDAVEEEYPPR